VFKAEARRQTREHNERAWAVWHIAALQRTKKLPKLDKLMRRESRRRPQTANEMLAVVTMLNAAYGGTITAKKV